MTDDELDAIVNNLVGDGNGLLGIACIVIQYRFELLAVHATGLVDLFNGQFATGKLHVPILGNRASLGASNGDLDGIVRHGLRSHTKQANCDGRSQRAFSPFTHILSSLYFFVGYAPGAFLAQSAGVQRLVPSFLSLRRITHKRERRKYSSAKQTIIIETIPTNAT